MQWTALNNAVALIGQWSAAALVDRRWYGRRAMQAVGFFAMFALFLVCAAGYGRLTASAAGFRVFQVGCLLGLGVEVGGSSVWVWGEPLVAFDVGSDWGLLARAMR